MQRFCSMLKSGLEGRGHNVRVIQPPAWLGNLPLPGRFAKKWLGYVDKFLAFPRQLKAAAAKADVVHICDHANAMYIKHLEPRALVVTCHDLLAVRGAMGEETDCVPSPTGHVLQRWILSGLNRAPALACVSSYTKSDVERLLAPRQRLIRLVANGLNFSYRVLRPMQARERLSRFKIDFETPFLFHVGSAQKRKNRPGLLRIFARLKDSWRGQLVLAGEGLTCEETQLAASLRISARVKHIGSVSNEELEALYNTASALVFPSRFEGFGWPIIEAQACGCPVVCSNRCSMPEVAGAGALVCDPDNERDFAAAVLSLSDPFVRQDLIEKGFENLRRFESGKMLDGYVDLYRAVLKAA